MRILHLTSTLEKGSGVMSVIMTYARELKKQDIYFDILYFNDSTNNYIEEIEQNGGRVYKIERPSISRSYKKYLNNLFRDINANNTYEVLHIHDVYLTFIFAPIAKKNNIPNVFTHSHATSYSDKFTSAIRNRILCINLKKNATKYLACSNAAGKFLYGKKAFKNNKVNVITNAIDPNKFKFSKENRKEIRDEYNIKDDTFVIGHVGRMAEQKNHKYLIDTFSKALKKNSNMKLILIGDGPLSGNVDLQIEKLGLGEDIIRIPSTSKVYKYLSAFDIFVLPSLFEGLPIVGVEAQANGLISIFSSNITKEIVLKDSFMISLKDQSNWIDEIIKLSNNSNDINRLDGIIKVKEGNYDINLESQKLIDLYHNVSKDVSLHNLN